MLSHSPMGPGRHPWAHRFPAAPQSRRLQAPWVRQSEQDADSSRKQALGHGALAEGRRQVYPRLAAAAAPQERDLGGVIGVCFAGLLTVHLDPPEGGFHAAGTLISAAPAKRFHQVTRSSG